MLISSSSAKRLVLDGTNISLVVLILFSWSNQGGANDIPNLTLGLSRFLLFFVLGALTSHLVNQTRGRTLGDMLFSQYQQGKKPDLPLLKSFWGWQLLISSAIVLVAATIKTQVSLVELFDVDGINSAGRLFKGLLSPDMSLLPVAVGKVIETVYIAFLATAMAMPIAFLLAFFAAKNIMTSKSEFLIYAVLRAILNITRSIEPVIWAIIFAVWVGVGPFAGMLALLVQSIASLTKQYSEHLEAVDNGPVDGIRATGATKLQTVWYAIVPQVILPYVSFTIYRWDINVRMATIIGFAGGGGIGTILYQYSMRAQWPEVGCLIAVIAAVVWIMDLMSAYIREALK